MLGPYDYFDGGNYNAICDICGFKRKASMLRLQWDGAMACGKCWTPRQPQDFVRGIPDVTALPWSRPEPPIPDAPQICTIAGRSCFSGLAVSGCSIAGLIPSL